MKALVVRNRVLKLVTRPVPEPEENELLIKIKMAGICNTDLEIIKGYHNFEGILGHEFVGTVEKDPTGDLTGERVVGVTRITCGECYFCKRNMDNHCYDRKTIGIKEKDGAFAEYMTLPKKNLLRVPDCVSDQEAVLVEPLAAAVEIGEQLHIKPTEKVAVLGDGKLGILTALTLWALGKDIILIGKHKEKMNIVEKIGIETGLLGDVNGPFDIVVDCTGKSDGFHTSISLVRPRGTIVLKTTIADRYKVDLSKVVVDEINLIGSRCGPFGPALRMIKDNNLPLSDVIDSIYPLHNGIKAFARAKEKGVLKVLISMD